MECKAHDLIHGQDRESGAGDRGKNRGDADGEQSRLVPVVNVVRREASSSEDKVLEKKRKKVESCQPM